MIWRYTAVTGAAQEASGLVWGDRAEAAARLEAQGLILVALEADFTETFKAAVSGGMIPPEKLAVFFRDFSNMLAAGLALSHILAAFKESAADGRIVGACARITAELEAGQSFAQAMELARVFPRLAVQVISAGERAGSIPLVMGLLAEYFQFMGELKGSCGRALIYPCGVVIFLLAALVYVAQAVVPQIAPLLPTEAMASPLTRGMLALSLALQKDGVICLTLLTGAAIALSVLIHSKRRVWEGCLIRLPVVGPVRKDLEITMCFFDLFVRLKSGIPLYTALRDSASASQNQAGEELERCAQYLAAGHTFSSALAQTGFFPRLLVETVKIGEETGSYDTYCERVFRSHYVSFQTRMGMFAAALQPLALGVCAIFIMAMAFAFLQPIYANLTRIGGLKP